MRCKWSTEELRLDYVERMNEQLRVCVSPDLLAKMQSPDFRKQVEALTHLTSFLSVDLSLFIESLDLIIKWIFVKMMDTTINTQVMKGILEMSAAMIAALEEDQYQLHQVEAEIFLMIMCDKSGHNNATFRTQIRGLMHSCTKIYPPAKVFNYVLQGVNSKNNRSKVECLEELGALVLEFGTSVYQPRDIKAISKFVSHTDGSVRIAAVGAVAEVYKLLEDRVWALIGECNDKAKEMLEQRFRMLNGGNSLSKTTPPKLAAKADVSTPRRPARPAEAPRTLTEPSDEEIPAKPFSGESKIPDVTYHPEELGRPDTLLYQDFDKLIPEIEPARPNILTTHIYTLLNQDMSAQVDSLVYINDELLSNVENYLEDFKEKGSQFIDAITKVMVQTFARPVAEVQIRFAKYFLSVVHKVCSSKQIMICLDEKTLYMLSEQVLRDLLIEDLDKLGERGEGELMLKTLNGTMLRILENCQATLVFVVLIRLLTRYRNDQSIPKMSGLIIRCLLKLTKILGNLKADLQVSRLLLAMHEYLIEHRGTTATDEIGNKTIKTILNELVKLEGERIWESYEAVRRHNMPDECIERWIRMMNSSLGPVPPISYQRLRSPPRAAGLPQELSEISAKLKAAETYDDGIRSLYGYTERNPGTELKFLPVELQRKVDEDIQRLRTRALETKAPSRFSLEAARAEAKAEIAAKPVEFSRPAESPKPAVEYARGPAIPSSTFQPQLSTPPRAGNENQEPESSTPFRIQDFQDRLAMMKKRYGLASSGDAGPPAASVSDLKTKVNSLLAPDSKALMSDMKARLDSLKKP
jgi:cytoskeleton-associated protein 5